MDEQLNWASWTPPVLEPATAESYREFRQTAEGEALYRGFVRTALRLKRSGWDHYTSTGVFEYVRMNMDLKVGPDAKVKANNNWRPYLAREAMDNEIELRGFFEIRRAKADRLYDDMRRAEAVVRGVRS